MKTAVASIVGTETDCHQIKQFMNCWQLILNFVFSLYLDVCFLAIAFVAFSTYYYVFW